MGECSVRAGRGRAETTIRRLTALTGLPSAGACRPLPDGRGSETLMLLLLCPLGLLAQAPLGNAPRINATDMAVLETREVRKDLACSVTPNKPELGFDLRFHGGFDVSVPVEALFGDENALAILFA